MSLRFRLVCLAAVLPALGEASLVRAQEGPEFGAAPALRARHPAILGMLDRLDRAHGLLLYELAVEGQLVREGGRDLPASDFQADLVGRLTLLVQGDGKQEDVVLGADGLDILGPRAAEVIRHGQALQREVVAALADPDAEDRSLVLHSVLERYRMHSDVALPSVPKDMDVLYDHAYALGFRTTYPELDGFAWSGHWFRLAATEPFTDAEEGPDRDAGLDTVTTRYLHKLSYGEPPHSFPSELPLAPAIAPGLVWVNAEVAMTWDNLSLLLEVLGDVLASPDTPDVPAAIEAAVDFFLAPELAVTDQDEWEIMALRHGIFFQGGYPLDLMLESERNVGGHAAHLGGGRVLTIPGMPRR